MDVTARADIGALYRSSRRRLSDMVIAAGAAGWQRPVPACPGWTVADVVGHLVGVIEDAAAGRIDGPPGPAQTALHVARHHGESVDDLVVRWARLAPPFEGAVSARSIVPAFLDVLSHEHDVRGALGVVGRREDTAVSFAAARLAVLDGVPVRIEVVAVPAAAPARHDGETWVLRTTAFEVLRFRLGRRTRDQVRALCWSADPDPVMDQLFVFGPAAAPFQD